MSRTIIFRAKHYEDKTYIYGVPIQCFDGDWQICTNIFKYTVDPNTIAQYIGLTDKKGNMIFEGDILQSDDGKIGYVAYVGCGFYKICKNYYNETFPIKGNYELIIGNIHDNKNLMKGLEK